jgi:hypothetical protein
MLDGGGRAMDFYAATVNPDDASFQVAGKDGKGVPPGKYRVVVEHLRQKKDLLKGEFDALKSPFVFDIDQRTGELTLDVARPNG